MNLAEISILEYIANNIQNPVLDKIMIFVSFLFNTGWLTILTGIILLFSQKNRKTGIRILISILICFIICNLMLKPLVGRIRPYNIASFPLIIKPLNDFSFPSGHSHASFSLATSIYLSNKKAGIILYILAVLVAFSRLYLFVHYPTDVIFGAFIGILISILTEKLILRRFNL